jgi:hypothetical protein
MITGASFQKPTFTVNGTNFTTMNIMVKINGQDVSALISNRSVSAISLTGNKKKLNLKKGANSIVVIANGLTSNTFSFTL